jgi:hypothetical protein
MVISHGGPSFQRLRALLVGVRFVTFDIFKFSPMNTGGNFSVFLFTLYCMWCGNFSIPNDMWHSVIKSSQRLHKSKSWGILLITMCMSFAISTFGWIEVWEERFCQNGFYFANTLSPTARDAAGKVPAAQIVFAYNVLFSLQVNLCCCFRGRVYPCMCQFLLGDAVVIWRTWAIWQGSWQCYLPICLWIASLGTCHFRH